jgi:hypothetical protein
MDEELSAAGSIGWGADLLAPVIEINERLLERLHLTACAARAARSGARHPGVADAAAAALGPAPTDGTGGLVQSLLHEWCALERPAQQRLARCPYLLLDAGFEDPARWRAEPAVHEAHEERGHAGCELDAAWLALVRRALLLAWHMARAQPLAARVLLGMGAASAQCIAARGLTDLDELALREAGRVAPRWQRQPQVWRQLLRASHGPAQELLWTQLRGLQLLAASGSA